MDTPTLQAPRRAAPDTDVLPSIFPAPGLGLVPVNAFVIHAKQPVLVDSGLVPLRDAFVRALADVIPLERLRWLWLTHADQDHIGSLHALLALVPQLRVVTTYIGVAKMSLFAPLPLDRTYLLNPGQRLDVGDRSLVCLRPPTFDAPETTALFDEKTRTLLSADSFGAVLQSVPESAESLSDETLGKGIHTWASIDSPWLALADKDRYEHSFDTIRALAPDNVLSSHLPPACGITDKLLRFVTSARTVPPFVGPDQPTFQQLLQQAAE